MIDTAKIRKLIARFDAPQDFPAPLTDAEIDAFEFRIGVRVPDDLRDWLRISNGAFADTVPVFGAQSAEHPLSMEKLLRIFSIWREKKWLPVAGDGCGNYYVMATQKEFGDGYPIVFVDAVTDKTAPRYIVASDLGHFLVFLMESELILKDMDPVETEPEPSPWFSEERVLREDPAITRFHGVPLPWGADKAD